MFIIFRANLDNLKWEILKTFDKEFEIEAQSFLAREERKHPQYLYKIEVK